MSKKREYILECPFCGQKHSIELDHKTLLDHPDKVFALQCAGSFSDVGCKRTIVIMSKEAINKYYTLKK